MNKKWFSVTLLKDHIHADVQYLKDDVIKVGQHVHDWLVKESVISPTKPDAAAPVVAVSAPPSSVTSNTPAKADAQESTK